MMVPRNIYQLKSKLDSTFDRAKDVKDAELKADLARYLCILVSGYLETAIVEWLLQYSQEKSTPTIQSFVEKKLNTFTNANSTRILSLLAKWNIEWHNEMNSFLVNEKKDAVDSVIANRNRIAHGDWVGLTFIRISDYYIEVEKVVAKMGEVIND